MSLSSIYLDAFSSVAKTGSFSKAAIELHISQSALSQRILNLESELEATLFLREKSGAKVTDFGMRLLRYCHSKEQLENEFISEFMKKDNLKLSGTLNIAGFSTVTRSIIIPKIKSLQLKNQNVYVNLLTSEVRELYSSLRTGKADIIITTKKPESPNMDYELFHKEENILIEPKLKNFRTNVFIDHDPQDQTTEQFWKIQNKKPKVIKRIFYDEIYTIIDAVELGLGSAVVPTHLALNKKVNIVKKYKPLVVPTYAVRHKQPFHTKLNNTVFDLLCGKTGS